MVDCSLVCKAPTEHLKMMRLLFLCLLLLLPAAAAASDFEGSTDDEEDDEDLMTKTDGSVDLNADKATGTEHTDNMTLIIIVVAAVVLTLSVATVVALVLVKRHMHSRQQGIYSVPIEQDQKGAI